MSGLQNVQYNLVERETCKTFDCEETIVVKGFGIRHVQAFILFLAVSIAYTLRVNLSVGIVAMTDNTTTPGIETVNWSLAQRGTILGSFFWGYLITQIPAGQLAGRIGATYPLGICMIVNGLTTILLPVAALYGGFVAACIARVVQGLGQGFIYPSVNTLMSEWSIPQERGRIYSFVFGGAQFGSIIMLISGGLLAACSWGWPSIFYVSGGISIAWGMVCLLYVADSPDKHKSISKEERLFIKSSLMSSPCSAKRPKTPWMSLLQSVPLWALLIAHMAQNWGYWTLLTLLPTYMNGVLKFQIKKNGLLSALPYIAKWVTSFIFSIISDALIRKKILSPWTSRKVWNSIAYYGGAIALTLLALMNTDTTGAIALLIIALAVNSGIYSGFMLNHLDLSPNFAGTLMGITNGLSNVTSILGPSIAGIIVTSNDNVSQWKIVFLIAAAVYTLGETVFVIFGSADVQSWNSGSEKENSLKEDDIENKTNTL